MIDGSLKFLGQYSSEEEAAEAYNNAAAKYHGEFARLNDLTSHLSAAS